MADGFLGYPSSFMLDVVMLSLIVVVPTLLFSLYLVKFQRNFVLHRNIQTLLGAVLLVAVSLFEIDMRMHGGFWEMTENHSSFMHWLLYVHLFFAVSTVPLWAATLILAWKRFPNPPAPNDHSPLHKRLGRLSAADITMTAVTGLMVYYYGFVAAVG